MDEQPTVGDVPTEGMLRINMRGKPKPRPKFDGRGVSRKAYNPAEYTQWKRELSAELHAMGIHDRAISVPVRMEAVFGTDYIDFQLFPLPHHIRPKWVTADVDNLVGGLMDGLQDHGLIANDKLIVEAGIWIPTRTNT